MARLGIFGGTFDPPHIGHLILADEACHQLHLDRVLWVLTPNPPHKLDKWITPLEHRLDMLLAAIRHNTFFELSSVEIDRPGPHYSVDTVRILSEQQHGEEWAYLMGGDSLRDLPIWKKPQELVESVSILGVMRRPGADIDLQGLEQKIPGISSKVTFVDTPLIEISASDIRQRIANGLPIRYFVPPQVYRIILDRDLYKLEDS